MANFQQVIDSQSHLLTLQQVIDRLDEVAYDFNYRTHSYRSDAFTRQGAMSLYKALAPLAGETVDETDAAYVQREAARILSILPQREDWRMAADKARVLPAITRILTDLSQPMTVADARRLGGVLLEGVAKGLISPEEATAKFNAALARAR